MASGNENKKFMRWLFGIDDYPLDAVTEWISENLKPEDVFTESDLEAWAEEHGYVKE